MEFPLTAELMENIAAYLRENTLARFREVRTASASSYANILGLLPEVTSFPAAIVVAGNVNPLNLGATRETEIAVIVIDSFRFGAEDLSTNTLVDHTMQALSGELGQPLILEGVPYLWESARPLDLADSMHTAWIITFTAKTCYKK